MLFTNNNIVICFFGKILPECLFKLNFNDRFVKLVVNILKLCLKNIDDSVFINICKEAVKKNKHKDKGKITAQPKKIN